MRPLLVVVPYEFCQRGPQMLLVQDDDVVKAFSAQSSGNSLRDGVHVRLRLPAVAVVRNESV
jgi:hypothetical protein